MFRVKASYLATAITTATATVVVGFTVFYVLLLGDFFALINSASSFFGSANVIMYLTIEGLFLVVVLYGAYVSLRRKNRQ